MAPSTRPEHHINLNYIPQLNPTAPHSGSSTGNTSPVDGSIRFPTNTAAGTRLGAGSPSHEYGSRLFSKRFVTR
jgi:protein JSN1